MLELIPAPLHRLGLKLAHALRTAWWRLRRPQIVGCRVMALDEDGHVLLIRHSYGSGRWSMPGGGVGRGEAPFDAALRELREEVGCQLVDPREIIAMTELLEGAGNRVHIVAGKVSGTVRIDRREVIEARFFPLDGLPHDIARNLPERMSFWSELYAAYSRES